jgi:phenylalanyl-tRNA synthetase beta chain
MALTGQRYPSFWQGADRDALHDIHDLKGIIETFLDGFGLRGVVFRRRPDPTNIFIESATVTLGGKVVLGELGQLSPLLTHEYDLRHPAFLAELDVDQLLARRVVGRTYKPLPAFPAIRRDVALLVPESTTHDAVVTAVRQARVDNLQNVELFDVFRGKGIPQDHKSVAYALTYRSSERTLTDLEVNAAHEQVLLQLKKLPGASIRE